MITTTADEIGHIHDRLPMFVDPGAGATGWTRPSRSGRPFAARPGPASGLTAYPVSTAVNNDRNNGPQLIEPAGRPVPARPRRH